MKKSDNRDLDLVPDPCACEAVQRRALTTRLPIIRESYTNLQRRFHPRNLPRKPLAWQSEELQERVLYSEIRPVVMDSETATLQVGRMYL